LLSLGTSGEQESLFSRRLSPFPRLSSLALPLAAAS
jgi:hypothetical protein